MSPNEVKKIVFTAAFNSYIHTGHEENKISIIDDTTMFISKYRRVENIITENSLDEIDTQEYETLRKNGNEVWVLVPYGSLSKARELLRESVDKIQPWIYENNLVRFGYPEGP